MIIRKKRVIGRGIKYRGNFKYMTRRGSGFFDIFKPIWGIIKTLFQHKDKIISTAKDVYNVGKNTKDIIQLLKKQKPPAPPPIIPVPSVPLIPKTDDIEDIISRTNKIRTGSSIRRINGRGFAFAQN